MYRHFLHYAIVLRLERVTECIIDARIVAQLRPRNSRGVAVAGLELDILYRLMGRAPSKDQKKLGRQIAKLRHAAGLTQDDLAERCSKEKQNISRLETGPGQPDSLLFS